MDAILLKAGSLMLIIAIGYGIKRRGWVSASDFPIFSNIVLRITLPCALAVSFDTFVLTPALLFIAVGAFVVNLVQEVAGFLLGRRHGFVQALRPVGQHRLHRQERSVCLVDLAAGQVEFVLLE